MEVEPAPAFPPPSPEFIELDLEDDPKEAPQFSCAGILDSQPEAAASPLHAASIYTWLSLSSQVQQQQQQHQPAPRSSAATAATVAAIFTAKVPAATSSQSGNSTVDEGAPAAAAPASAAGPLVEVPVMCAPELPPAAAPAAPAHPANAAAAAACGLGFLPNLTLPTIKKHVEHALIRKHQGDVAAIAKAKAQLEYSFYLKRGPQAIRRMLVRRLRVLFPLSEAAYQRMNRNSACGSQFSQEDCEAYFADVLGPQGLMSAPWPVEVDLRPMKELLYLAKLLSWLAGKPVTAAQVNDCFEPGLKDWTVDYGKLAKLGVPAATITMPLRPLQGMWLLMPSSNVSSTSALAAQGAAAGLSTALAAGRLTTLYAKNKAGRDKRSSPNAASTGRKKKTRIEDAADALAHPAAIVAAYVEASTNTFGAVAL